VPITYGGIMRASIFSAAAVLFACLCLFSCSAVRQIRPLTKGESSVALSVGGPITQAGKIYIPLPLISVGYNYGLLEKLDLEAGFHVLSAVYGITQFDLGANLRPWAAAGFRPGLIVSPKVFVMTDWTPASLRLYPDIGLTAYWEMAKYRYWYLGIDNWIEYHQTRDDGNPQKEHWLIAPYAGISLGNSLWQFQLEAKWYTPNLVNNTRAVKNIGIGQYGVIGVFLGISRSFGGAR
jgi:hypothetical protein